MAISAAARQRRTTGLWGGIKAGSFAGREAAVAEPAPSVARDVGDGGAIGRNAWREQRERDEREIELELADLTAIARLAAQQLARDHMARQARR